MGKKCLRVLACALVRVCAEKLEGVREEEAR